MSRPKVGQVVKDIYRNTKEYTDEVYETDNNVVEKCHIIDRHGNRTNKGAQSKPDRLGEKEFSALVKKWRKDTQHLSSVLKMVRHPAYRSIIGMGFDVLPYLFKELKERPDHWLVALNAITGEDPAPPKSTFEQAVHAWLKWGGEKGYL